MIKSSQLTLYVKRLGIAASTAHPARSILIASAAKEAARCISFVSVVLFITLLVGRWNNSRIMNIVINPALEASTSIKWPQFYPSRRYMRTCNADLPTVCQLQLYNHGDRELPKRLC